MMEENLNDETEILENELDKRERLKSVITFFVIMTIIVATSIIIIPEYCNDCNNVFDFRLGGDGCDDCNDEYYNDSFIIHYKIDNLMRFILQTLGP